MLGTRYQAVLYSFPEHNPKADVDFWWIKPMASDKREIEPQTLNLHHAPPHKNDPGRSRALYAQFADLFNVCHLHGVIHDAAILDHHSSHAFTYCFYINLLTTCFPRHAFHRPLTPFQTLPSLVPGHQSSPLLPVPHLRKRTSLPVHPLRFSIARPSLHCKSDSASSPSPIKRLLRTCFTLYSPAFLMV